MPATKQFPSHCHHCGKYYLAWRKTSLYCSGKCLGQARMKAHVASFWRKCRKDPETGCWIWIDDTDKDGYGIFHTRAFDKNKRDYQAHRLSWIITHGPIPEGQQVLHDCDNPPCINPGHLHLGDNRDNQIEALARGRRSCTFTNTEVVLIVTDPRSDDVLAKEYGVAIRMISKIRSTNPQVYVRLALEAAGIAVEQGQLRQEVRADPQLSPSSEPVSQISQPPS